MLRTPFSYLTSVLRSGTAAGACCAGRKTLDAVHLMRLPPPDCFSSGADLQRERVLTSIYAPVTVCTDDGRLQQYPVISSLQSLRSSSEYSLHSKVAHGRTTIFRTYRRLGCQP
jgi:hypothetical protein